MSPSSLPCSEHKTSGHRGHRGHRDAHRGQTPRRAVPAFPRVGGSGVSEAGDGPRQISDPGARPESMGTTEFGQHPQPGGGGGLRSSSGWMRGDGGLFFPVPIPPGVTSVPAEREREPLALALA